MRTQHSNIALVITIIGTAICFYLFNSVVPYYSDDWWHSFIHKADRSYPTEPVKSLGDILTSQINHYQTVNGRLLVTALVQAVVSFCPKWLFDILNTLIFILTAGLLTRYISPVRFSASHFLLSAVTLFYLLPGHYDTMMWAAGAINYLWVAALVLILLLLWRKSSDTTFRPITYPLFFILGLITGWSNEALSFGLAAGLFIEIICSYKSGIKPAQWCLSGGAILGACMILFTPGSWGRFHPSSNFDITIYLQLFFALLLPLLLILSLIILWRKEKNYCSTFMRQYRISIISSLAFIPSSIICITTWQAAPRTCYGVALFAAIPLLHLLYQYVLPRITAHRVVKYGLLALLVAYTGILMVEHNRIEKAHRSIIEQYSSNIHGDGIVVLDTPRRAWFATPFTLNLDDEYNLGWTARHMAYYYNGEPMQWMSVELHQLLTHPDELFTPHNHMTGNTGLYTTPTLPFYVLHPDSVKPEFFAYSYTPVSFTDDVPLQSKVMRLWPHRYPDSEILPAYYTSYKVGDNTYHTIEKSVYRNNIAINLP